LANIKSAIKRMRSSKKRMLRNRAARSRARSAIRDTRSLIASDADQKKVAEAIREASSALDKAAEKGVLHKKNAARRKSRLMKAAAKAQKATK
jgi:small subunit ribosomal protein S20